MANQLTEEQETSLANMVEQARDRARAVWKSSVAKAAVAFDLASNDEAFDRGFDAAMDFAISDEFAHFVSRLKFMLDETGWSSH